LRNQALLRQAGANVINILKKRLFERLPPTLQHSFRASAISATIDWARVELTTLEELYSALPAHEHVAFLAGVNLPTYKDVQDLGWTAGLLKDKFNAEDHATTHLDGSAATFESCMEALQELDPEGTISMGADLMSWLFVHSPGPGFLFNRGTVV
jgi:hypothetical protein